MLTAILALLAALIFLVSRRLAPDPSIASLPTIPFWKTVYLFIQNVPFDERYRELRVGVPTNTERLSRVWIAGRWLVQTSNAEFARKITAAPQLFPKVVLADKPRFRDSFPVKTFGRNVVGTVGTEWKRHRNIVSPPFAKPLSPEPFAKSVELLLTRFAELDGQIVEAYSWMQRLTLDVLGRGIFSFDFESMSSRDPGRYVALYNDMIGNVLHPISVILPFWSKVPTQKNLRTHKMSAEFRELLGGMVTQRVKERKASDQGSNRDLLDMMIDSAYTAEADAMHSLSPEELVNDLAVFFVAGHDTTSNALSTALHFLALYPDVQERARAHVKEVMKKYPRTATGDASPFDALIPSADAVRNFDFITAIIKESLRLYPSAAILGIRRCVEETQFGSYVFPKDTWVQVDIYGMHRDEKYWPDPAHFNPDRFMDTDKAAGTEGTDDSSPTSPTSPGSAKATKAAWMPFGGGSRICLGMQFSLMEQKVALAMMLLGFRFELPDVPDADKYRLATGVLLRPEEANVVLHKL
ncbi:cytochrome P450 [Geranomyces variabilis]|nr:cytochrome P450 [Geranomyces variabilis]KAJ3133925.1 hypothetical protein HDU90_005534 [Geranomyces variabilis]